MKRALISIKPIYADKIRNGSKKWEFRKQGVKDFEYIYLYETKPVGRITIKLKISEVIKDNPYKIWKITQKESGLTKEEFFNYFKDKNTGYAYKIDSFQLVDIDIIKNNITPPWTVSYIEEDELK